MKIAIKLGGFAFKDELKTGVLKSYTNIFNELYENGHELVIVTGGGDSARKYTKAARELGASEVVCDQVGIMASRLNANLLVTALKNIAFPSIPESIEELKDYFSFNKIVVMGGLQPGQSTDAVAALAAEVIKADLLIYTKDVDGVYTKDPNKDLKAKKIEQISIKELLNLIISEKVLAGKYELIDLVAIKLIERSKVPTWIISGLDVENIKKVLLGEHVGTRILID
ncbi:MAG: UMP kinase [Candidatus Bathyarchaeia archaeon]